jgi:hypothetical protein
MCCLDRFAGTSTGAMAKILLFLIPPRPRHDRLIHFGPPAFWFWVLLAAILMSTPQFFDAYVDGLAALLELPDTH